MTSIVGKSFTNAATGVAEDTSLTQDEQMTQISDMADDMAEMMSNLSPDQAQQLLQNLPGWLSNMVMQRMGSSAAGSSSTDSSSAGRCPPPPFMFSQNNTDTTQQDALADRLEGLGIEGVDEWMAENGSSMTEGDAAFLNNLSDDELKTIFDGGDSNGTMDSLSQMMSNVEGVIAGEGEAA